jgi:hypothetical protein
MRKATTFQAYLLNAIAGLRDALAFEKTHCPEKKSDSDYASTSIVRSHRGVEWDTNLA